MYGYICRYTEEKRVRMQIGKHCKCMIKSCAYWVFAETTAQRFLVKIRTLYLFYESIAIIKQVRSAIQWNIVINLVFSLIYIITMNFCSRYRGKLNRQRTGGIFIHLFLNLLSLSLFHTHKHTDVCTHYTALCINNTIRHISILLYRHITQ